MKTLIRWLLSVCVLSGVVVTTPVKADALCEGNFVNPTRYLLGLFVSDVHRQHEGVSGGCPRYGKPVYADSNLSDGDFVSRGVSYRVLGAVRHDRRDAFTLLYGELRGIYDPNR